MLEHVEPRNVCRTSIDGKILFLNSMVEVVVFAAPAVEAVGKAVDLPELKNKLAQEQRLN